MHRPLALAATLGALSPGALLLAASAAAQTGAVATVAAVDTAARQDSVARSSARKPAKRAAAKRRALVEAADGSFKLDVFFRLQGLYQEGTPDASANQKSYGDSFTNKVPEDATSSVRIRRGRFGIEGYAYDPRIEYHAQIELAGATTFLKRAYINYKARGDALQLRAGKFKVPYGRQQLTSWYVQQLVDRAAVSDEFAKGDDDGAMAWGMPFAGKLEWYAGVFNGEGNNKNTAQRTDNQWAARLVWSPLGKVAYAGSSIGVPRTLGLSVGLNANRNGGAFYEVNGKSGLQTPVESCAAGACTVDRGDDAHITNLGADLALRWRGLSATAEWFARTVDPKQSGLADYKSRGWYAQAGTFLLKDRLEAGGRYGQLDPSRAVVHDRVTEVSPFVNVYVSGNDVKLQADYTLQSTQLDDRRAGAAAHSLTTLGDRRLRVALVTLF